LQGAHPIVSVGLPDINQFFFKYAKNHQLEYFPTHWFDTVKQAQGYIGINTETNTRELTSADSKKISTRQKIMHPISDYIVNERKNIRRVTIAFPCISHAQEADLSLTEWENFVYSSCLQDWKKLGRRMDKIASYFRKAKEVYLKGENVDLKFQIRGRQLEVDKGEENMPGGEIFMAPVRESLQGWIKFDYPRIVSGKRLAGVKLTFDKGKVIDFDAEEGKDLLKALLETDKNSSYVGELGIGCNPRITRYSNNLLFDEKIGGTVHLALGMAYKRNGGGNDSAIHVDIVKDMKKAKIILNGKIVQANGKWRI